VLFCCRAKWDNSGAKAAGVDKAEVVPEPSTGLSGEKKFSPACGGLHRRDRTNEVVDEKG